MRGTVDELISPHPLGAMLPGVYQGDDFAQRFTAGLDDVIAPVLSTLDNLAAYFDPATAPDDFLDFLSRWVGIDFEASWSMSRRRQVIAHAVDLHRRRGTSRGIREAVALVTDAAVEVVENGGSSWSQAPGSRLPGDPTPHLVVRIDADELSDLDRRRIDALVGAVKPAFVPHEIELGPIETSDDPGQGGPDDLQTRGRSSPAGGADPSWSQPDARADRPASLADDEGATGGD